ncbi:hypothetical protein [Nafulsella turpanensis]|uniref:hypothetical protein n=1 Tax=Nafulsella turpanensis TaxID=1265690 RepID=UPI0003490A95|nr:hypothetical protein [Nafulsella turpanensis]
MNRKNCSACLIILFGWFALAGCGTSEDGQIETVVDCPSAPDVQVAEKVDTLNIIIETSGSMAGFMPSRSGEQTNFQMQIDELLANAEALEGNDIRTLRYYSARDKIYKEVYSRFVQMLRRGLKNAGSSTPIPGLLRDIAESFTGEDQVSLFISDFIYAPPNSRDRDFIANDIRRALNQVENENFVVSVFALKSDFAGTFYPAASENPGGRVRPITPCCETEVPYYIWVMGPEEKVRMVNQEIIRNSFAEQLHLGFAEINTPYGIIPGSGREGGWYPADREGKIIQLDNPQEIKEEGVTYTIGLMLDGLPGQVRSTEYLEEHLKLQVENGEGRVKEVYDRASFLTQATINNKDRKLIDCYSHYVTVVVDKVYDRNSDINLQLQLENSLPPWVGEYTTENDSRIEEEGPKTYSLNAIIDGAGRAVREQEGTFFNVSTTIDLSR